MRQLGAHSLLQDVEIDFTPTREPTTALVSPERFSDVLRGLIEGVAGAGAGTRRIEVRTLRQGGRVVVCVASPDGAGEAALGTRRLDLYHRMLSRAGGGVAHKAGVGFDVWAPEVGPGPESA